MNQIPCPGLDGANPLHALAAFGLLHLSDRIHPGASLSWQRIAGAWRPVLHLDADPDAHIDALAAWLVALGQTANADPSLAKAVGKTKADRKKLAEELKKAEQAAKADAKTRKLGKAESAALIADRTTSIQADLRRLDGILERQQSQLATALGTGIAHLGDIIGTQAEVVRAVAVQAVQAAVPGPGREAVPRADDGHLVLAHAAALACDGVMDGDKVKPTPFSFGNGSSGQCLLKDFRGIACAITPAQVRGTLQDDPARWVEDGTALNWDPMDQRSYALTWDDPATSGKRTDAAANALAYVGLALVPALPVADGLGAVAWGTYGDRSRGWTWPLWEAQLPVSVVRALLAHGDLQGARPDARAWNARGVLEIRRCLTINPTGKRLFFAPSQPV